MINKKAADVLQLADPIGRIGYTAFNTEGEIVAIIEDFNFASLHNTVEPLVIEYLPAGHPMRPVLCNYMLVKINGENIPATLEYMEETIQELAPASLFTFTFMDEKLSMLYESENRMSNMFKAFAALAIFISCLGLFGLSSYSAQLHVKEIGVRKVLGASVANIMALMSKNFIVWILVANVIALPLAWLMMQQWLADFAYRIHIGIFSFTITIFLSIAVAFITVSYQALKAAYADPVDSLKYE
jgi:putative ABC transport system permease protein